MAQRFGGRMGGSGMFGGPYGIPPGHGAMRQGGGLLSRLFRRQAGLQGRQAAAAGFSKAAAQGAVGGGGLTGFLDQTQQVLKTMQQAGPIIQQYGPMIKNLPAMWRLYKGFRDIKTEGEQNDPESAPSLKSSPNAKSAQQLDVKEIKEHGQKRERKQKNGKSVPKIYVP